MPVDEIALTRAAERAARADHLMRDELLCEAFDTLDAEYVKMWRTLPALDTDSAERLRIAVNVLAKVRDHLGRVLAGGKLAQKELNDLAERKRRFGII